MVSWIISSEKKMHRRKPGMVDQHGNAAHKRETKSTHNVEIDEHAMITPTPAATPQRQHQQE